MEKDEMDGFSRFSGSITDNGERVDFSVCEEVITKYRQRYPISRFLVKGRHPQQGTFAFFLLPDTDNDGSLTSQYCPKFLSKEFVKKISLLIEHHIN